MGRKRGIQYRGGTFLRTCDRSGFVTKAPNTKQEWTQAIVERRFWEARQPQDFVRGVKDDQTVPQARPQPPPIFVGPIFTTLSQNAALGATFLYLASVAGITASDKVGVMLDSGIVFNTSIVGPPASNGVNISAALPYAAASGNTFQDYEMAAGP